MACAGFNRRKVPNPYNAENNRLLFLKMTSPRAFCDSVVIEFAEDSNSSSTGVVDPYLSM